MWLYELTLNPGLECPDRERVGQWASWQTKSKLKVGGGMDTPGAVAFDRLGSWC